MKHSRLILTFIAPLLFLLSLSSCSGGNSSNNKSSNQTGVRVFHAGLDAIPLGLFVGDNFIGETSYLANSVFTPIRPQEAILRLTRSDRFNEPVIEFPVSILPHTEYSVFVYGEVKRGSFRVRLLEEPLVVPESGSCRVQFLHGLIDQGSVRFRLNGAPDVTLSFGDNSGFLIIPAGENTVSITDSSSREISRTRVNAPDGGELSILLAGRTSYNFVTVKVYEDFD
jgi:hypothetical protein